ncbi:MAG: hypothetical protein ABW217_05710 [Polyangiaceae bacterium]
MVALAALINGSLVRPAFAQGSDPATARALFAEGRKLMAEKKYEDACPKFEESLRLDHGMGTQFNLAFCWEQQGRTASAWATFLDVAAAARAAGQSEPEAAARDRASALEPKLSRLTIKVPAPVESLEVTRDEVAVGRAAWGSAVPVDPGTHTLKASAPGKKPWQQQVSVAGGSRVSVDVPKLDDAPVAVAAAVTEPEPVRSRSDEPARDMETLRDEGVNGTRVAAWVIGGVGVVGLGLGTFFALKFQSERDKYDGLCVVETNCPEPGPGEAPTPERVEFFERKDNALAARTGAYVSFGVAGAALVTSTILFITSGQNRDRGDISVAPLLGSDDGWGAALSGSF